MKKKLMTAFLTAASLGFAAEQMPTTKELPIEVKHKMVEPVMLNSNWFGYLRMGLSDSRANTMEKVVPGLGLGCRFGLPVGALDLSATYTGDNYWAKQKSYVFSTFPRVAYFLYLSPAKEQSLYAGPGVAYGIMQKKGVNFSGIIPSLSVGYEMNRLQNWRSFIQMDVSQPALSTDKVKPYMHKVSMDLGPVLEASVGFGY
jgi:hypothetical protein